MWDYCGMERTEEGLRKAIDLIRELKEEFWSDVKVLGTAEELNQALERAGRVADFFELGELMCIDALDRRESCGGHFRVECQTEDGEALRDDDEFAYVVGLGVRRRRTGGRPAQGAAGLRVRRDEAAELQVRIVDISAGLAPGGPATPAARWPSTRSTTSPSTCRSWRCSTCSTSD